MRTIYRSLLAVAAAVVFSASAAAQTRPPMLTKLQVQQLVIRGDLDAELRLALHFAALADDYAAAAQRQTVKARSFGGNPNRTPGASTSARFERLAALNRQSAELALELVAYHGTRAAGFDATLPGGATALEGGAGAAEPTEKELNVLAAKARTPSERGALDEYYTMLAMRYTTDARDHAVLAQAFRGTKIASAGVEHDRLANLAKNGARKAAANAAMHRRLVSGRGY